MFPYHEMIFFSCWKAYLAENSVWLYSYFCVALGSLSHKRKWASIHDLEQKPILTFWIAFWRNHSPTMSTDGGKGNEILQICKPHWYSLRHFWKCHLMIFMQFIFPSQQYICNLLYLYCNRYNTSASIPCVLTVTASTPTFI